MKFVIPTQELNYLISKVLNVVPLKPTVPIVGNILIEASKGEIILTATDFNVGIRCHAEAEIQEEGATTLPSKKFAQLIREISTLNVEISTSPNQITTLIAGSSRFKLNGMSKEDFPELPHTDNAPYFELPQKTFKELLSKTAFAVSREDNRYVLTGVLMEINGGLATFVGTDGKRLARAFSQVEIDPTLQCQSVIPIKAVEEIIKNLTDEGNAKISVMSDKISVEANDTKLIAKLLMGDYPDYMRIIPQQPEILLSLHKDELVSLLKQVSLFVPDSHRAVHFAFSDGEVRVNANSIDIGEGQVAMPVNYHGPKLELALNPGFMIDLLRQCKNEIVSMGLTDPYNPGIITDQEEPLPPIMQSSPLFVIMPMRLIEET